MSLSSMSPKASQARALFAKGLGCHKAGQLIEAQALYRQVLQLMPSQADALHMLGVTEFQHGHYDAAVSLLDKASRLLPRNDSVHFNLGNALRAATRLDEAGAAFRTAIRLSPGNLDALKNLGNVLKEQNRYEEALACYDDILAIDGDDAYTRYNKAIALLTTGHLAQGWDLYEDRLRCDLGDGRHAASTSPAQAPVWQGEALSGPLLVIPEQGLGDQIFYGAMLADLQAAGIGSVACVDERLLALFRRSFPGIGFATMADIARLAPSEQQFSAQLPMASLGRHFRRNSDALARIRSPYLVADSELTTLLRSRFLQGQRLVCGISWSSQARTGATKSLPLQALLPVLRTPGVEFIDLQYGDTRAERQTLAGQTEVRLKHIDEIDNTQDIDALAALISACDLVITVSNSTAHLAAALGKPTLILLAHHTPLWYWHADGMQSPWYPTVTLLRQVSAGDWNPTVEMAAHILRGLANGADA